MSGQFIIKPTTASIMNPAYSLQFVMNDLNDSSGFPEMLSSSEIVVSVFLMKGVHHYI